jgi:hypothetical protein
VHPVKILGGLHLDGVLVTAVAPASERRLITASAASGNAFTAMSPT